MKKERRIPIPTMAAVSSGASPAIIARAPAETMGGIPASKMATRMARVSIPRNRQMAKARRGATISLTERPMSRGDIISGRSRGVSW